MQINNGRKQFHSPMRQLTIKDIASYYSPCLACKSKTTLILSVYSAEFGYQEIVPKIIGKSMNIDLKISYYSRFVLNIDIMSHKFLTSNITEFMKYAAENVFCLFVYCKSCHSYVETTKLEFNITDRILKPISLVKEGWSFIEDDSIYKVDTIMDLDQTKIVVDKISGVKPISPWSQIVSALPIHRFGSKENMIEKIKLYMVFS